MKRLAITGGTGFIGSWFIREFSSAFDIKLIDLESFLSPLKDRKVNFQYVSTDYSISSLTEILTDVDTVLHLAAKRPASKATEYCFTDFLVNVEISSNLFEACKIRNIKNIINISSTSVYGKKNTIPYREEEEPFPNGFYGLSKKTIEILSEFYNRNYGLCIKTLRLAHVIGLGEKESFMFMVFVNKARNKETLNVYGKGEGRREYIYVKDVASAIDQAIRSRELKGVYNIGTGQNTSHKELAQVVNTVFENDDNLSLLSDKAEDKSVDRMDVTKASKELSWNAKWTLSNSIEDIKDYLEHKNTF